MNRCWRHRDQPPLAGPAAEQEGESLLNRTASGDNPLLQLHSRAYKNNHFQTHVISVDSPLDSPACPG